MKPLDGILILDLTRLLPGAVATLLLQRAGATIVKIEEPVTGDYGRTMGDGVVFRFTNAGKKSVALDLKNAAQREAFWGLAERADVVVEGFRPGVMERLGLGFDAVRARCPRLIYASLSGYPRLGTDASSAGHDINYLAVRGALTPPYVPKVQMADIAGGSLPLVNGILLALLERHRTGRGSRVDVAMTEGIEPLLILPRALEAAGHPNFLDGRYPCYNLYQCADSRWVAVGSLELKFWVNLCRAAGREDWIAVQFQEAALPAIREFFRTRPSSEWIGLCAGKDCCLTAVAELEPAGAPEGPAPALGEQTEEVFASLGLRPPDPIR